MASSTGFAVALLLLALSSSPAVLAINHCDRHNDCAEDQFCFFSYDHEHNQRGKGICFSDSDSVEEEQQPAVENLVLLQESASVPEIKKFDPSGLKVSSLTVQAPEGKNAKVVLGSGAAGLFSIGVAPDGVFTIKQGEDKEVLKVDKEGNVVARTKVLAAGSLKSDAGFLVNNVAQWALAVSEDFSLGTEGWATKSGEVTTSKCSSGHVLMGLYSSEVITKTYKDLPKHTRIRVQAVFHFVDAWQGETGYMKLSSGKDGSLEYAWTETYDMANYANLIDVCGGERGEGKFAVPIDVTIYHTGDTLDISFGSTLEEAAGLASYGVSSVDISWRTVHETKVA